MTDRERLDLIQRERAHLLPPCREVNGKMGKTWVCRTTGGARERVGAVGAAKNPRSAIDDFKRQLERARGAAELGL